MFKLPSEITIAQVDACKTQLIDYINENDEVAFDDSDVTRIDTVGIQLLLCAVTYIASQNKSLSWSIQSSMIIQSIKQLGINEPILSQYLNS